MRIGFGEPEIGSVGILIRVEVKTSRGRVVVELKFKFNLSSSVAYFATFVRVIFFLLISGLIKCWQLRNEKLMTKEG